MYAVILAGGGGTRLRPLSRADRPKPFLPLMDDRTLLQRTVERLRRVDGLSGIFVVVSTAHVDLVIAQAPEVDVIAEPAGRNTAAAIALATLVIERPADEVMAVLPADHMIGNSARFAETLGEAARLARGAFGVAEPLVTLGVQMERPATEYGYLMPKRPGAQVEGLQSYVLDEFREKPPAAEAQRLYEAGSGIAWNAGMFLWQRRAIRAALGDYTDLVETLEPALDDPDELAEAYAGLRTRSIDYEVMEPASRAGRVVMASMDVGWSDIGGWTALLAAIGAGGTGRVAEAGETIQIAAEDLLVGPGPRGLELVAGPGTIRVDAPSAHLVGAGADRDRVQALLDRVAAAESHAP
ncbi:MAG: hypothetical protein FJ038_01935 [Chloroflexi bacterium]|nr:hypothetical protein [Chloroflexota bacterium]